jgi:hypothetical protein
MSTWPEITPEQIVARLRMIVSEPESLCKTDLHYIEDAADEIERLRAEISLYHQIRIDYCNAWSKWIDEHDHLDAMEWCRAYSNAVPHPNPDGPEVYQLIHSRLDAKFRQAADEIERLRAELLGNAEELARLRERVTMLVEAAAEDAERAARLERVITKKEPLL